MIGSAALFIAAMLAEAATATPPAAAPDPRDKVTCRREAPIGSLILSKKVCHTRREWDQIAGNTRTDVETIRDRASSFRSE